ncbi:hypothetical protein SAMN04488067_101535 [Halorubrum xinjiangense]|uniref:CDP-Glycerol:Poly(Glycerophosphate) glycerophosphotransferase n=1 Tax=Halorubrum xinjiangense TaxID=261291 RepID=A0A1G7HVE7_9EURY|nr:hypothetical protein [Halorubrum xinjiangense]SDF04521.1 hypothetical protein SAMN04488067_101535 [Halorubrum xinjiangense]
MNTEADLFKSFEKDCDLYSIKVEQIPIWERIRFRTFREITRKKGQGQAHTHHGAGINSHLKGLSLWLKYSIYKNPYFADEHDFLFYGHQRRKLEEDGYWWDIYCDPIHEQNEFDYIHVESPHLMSHHNPAKTQYLRYLDPIRYTGTLQRRLGIRTPSIPTDIISRLQEAEEEIKSRFDLDIDLISKVRQSLHVRNTILPLYERLLDRINPDVVVVVVSYGKETFIEACKRLGIPVVELQHGVIYDHHFGYNYPNDENKSTFPDYILTFGEFWSKNVSFPIPGNRVKAVGYPYLEQRLKMYDDIGRSKQLLFISQGTIGDKLSQFAVKVHEDDRIDHKVVYKLHPGEYERWQKEYPWLVESDIRVIDESKPPLYQLFTDSTAQIGVGSTAVYEGLCFDLDTFVFETENTDILQPLIDKNIATSIKTIQDLNAALHSKNTKKFNREIFFKSNATQNIIDELKYIQDYGTTNRSIIQN